LGFVRGLRDKGYGIRDRVWGVGCRFRVMMMMMILMLIVLFQKLMEL